MVKKLQASVAVLPAPVRVTIHYYLPRVSRQSRLSANDKGNNEMIPGAVHRSHGIYLTAEKTPGIPQLEDRQRRLRDQSSPKMGSHTSKLSLWVPTCTSERKKEPWP